MTHATKIRLCKLAALLAIGGAAFVPGSRVLASGPTCKRVHARLFLQAEQTPTCGSEIGLCASGDLIGPLEGSSSFVGTSFSTTRDTNDTLVVLLTGNNRIDTGDGVLLTKDAIVLRQSGNGEFAEVDQVVGGSGRWHDATGTLTATGTFVNGAGEGLLSGEICTP